MSNTEPSLKRSARWHSPAIWGIIVAILIIAKNPTVGRAIIGVAVGAFIAGLPWIIPAVGELFRGDVEAAPAPGTVNEQIVAEPDKAETVSAG